MSNEQPTLLELAHQALCSLERGYDLLAPKFDATVFRTPPTVLDVLDAQLTPIENALDLGCGTGAVMERLTRVCSGRITGIDLSSGMLNVCRRNLKQEVELIHGDFLTHDFASDYDLVTCFGALGHVETKDQARLARQAFNALRSGGRFLTAVSDLSPPRPRFYWLAWLFDAAMRLRNLVWRPKFVMYYLTFPLDRAVHILREAGFEVTVLPGPATLWGGAVSRLKLLDCRKNYP